MSTYIADGLPGCDSCFICYVCQRRVCGDSEVVLCVCTDDPTCGECCSEWHGGEA